MFKYDELFHLSAPKDPIDPETNSDGWEDPGITIDPNEQGTDSDGWEDPGITGEGDD